MAAGQVVIVDWRDALLRSGEPNKQRPAILVGSQSLYDDTFLFELVVPLSGVPELAITGASVEIMPDATNGCIKKSYALAWNVQCVPRARITYTDSYVSGEIISEICRCVRDTLAQ